MAKFVCRKCGACSTDFGPLNNLPLFGNDVYTIQEEAKKRKIKLKIVPLDVFYDKEINTYFTSTIALTPSPCPFLGKNKLCTIYKKRPLVCKVYPIIFDPLERVFKIDKKCKYTKEISGPVTKENCEKLFGKEIQKAMENMDTHHKLVYKYLERVFATRDIERIKDYSGKAKVLPFFEYLSKLNIIEKEDKEIIRNYCKK